MGHKELWPGWETVDLIGSGGFGKVYEIKKQGEGAVNYRSALKVIDIPPSQEEYQNYSEVNGYNHEEITTIFKSQMEEIVAEFQMMSQFKGVSNIVSYEDHMVVPHEDGVGWRILIRMELLKTLPQHYNANGGMDDEEVIRVGRDIARALELCGQKGIIHRDIKPQNIFINEFGDFKLGDFGVAKVMEHTTKATKIGTYSYMAPEIYRDQPYHTTADIYSLGLVLYWLLNERRLPFQPLPPEVPTVSQNEDAQKRRLNGETLPPPVHGSEALKQVVLKACSPEPTGRYETPGELRKALARVSTTTKLADEQASPVGDPQPRGPEVWQSCASCGQAMYKRMKYCPQCGADTGVTIGPFDEVCPHCHCVVPLDSKVCPECGKKTVTAPPPSPPPPPSADPSLTCPYCGKLVEADERVCKRCGKELKRVTCLRCGGENIKGAKKCAACGHVFKTAKGASQPDGSVPPDNSCPWCHGSGREFRFRGKGGVQISDGKYQTSKFVAYEDKCKVCGGTGRTDPSMDATYQKQLFELKNTDAYQVANRLCPYCRGMGYVHMNKMSTLFPCPSCANKRVIERPVEEKKKWIALLLCLCPVTGIFGIHRFYLGAYGAGICFFAIACCVAAANAVPYLSPLSIALLYIWGRDIAKLAKQPSRFRTVAGEILDEESSARKGR